MFFSSGVICIILKGFTPRPGGCMNDHIHQNHHNLSDISQMALKFIAMIR